MKINSYLLIALLLAASVALIIFIPRWQEENYRASINSEDIAKLEPKDRVQLQKDLALVENSFRATLAQIIGGSLLLLSLYLTYRNVKIAQENLRVTEEGKLTDRFSKAVELLGDKKLEVRLGGIYALERIARDSQKDHWTVMEVLTAFVRENSHKKLDEIETPGREDLMAQKDDRKEKEVKLREDIQAIMTVIGRRKWIENESPRRLDLGGVNLAKCNLREADLSQARFYKANLAFADLREAKLRGASLYRADLSYADLNSSDLRRANLQYAHLGGANLSFANLSGAKLLEAHLGGANLGFANLGGAKLDGADLNNAKLNGAKLGGATFLKADLSKANLYKADLDDADLAGAQNITLEQLLSAKSYNAASLSEESMDEVYKHLENSSRIP